MKNLVSFALWMAAGAALQPLAVQAQWQWTDAQGRSVFSDRPPPLEVPEKNIVKRPAPRSPDTHAKPAPGKDATSSDTEAKAGDKPPATGAASGNNGSAPPSTDPELEAKKLQAQAAQKAQQQADAERQAQIRADNCTRARQAKANLDSGLPLMQINAQGHRVLMDEATKAAEMQRIQGILSSDCPR